MGEVCAWRADIVHLDTSEAEFALQLAEAELAAVQANYDLVAAGTPTSNGQLSQPPTWI